jgi:hypothetical protein
MSIACVSSASTSSGTQFTRFNGTEVQILTLLLLLLSEQYPDNMEVCFMFPVTWVMSACVAVCRPMVSDETFKKHKILRESEWRDALLAAYEVHELEPQFGGTLQLSTSLHRNYLLENPAALSAWEAEEELAMSTFVPGKQVMRATGFLAL